MKCKCGGDIFWESTRAGGWWKSVVNSDGKIIDTNLDDLTRAPIPKTVICEDCGRRNPNPRYRGVRR